MRFWLLLCFLCLPAAGASRFNLVCSSTNDLYLTLRGCGLEPARFDTPAQAVEAAPRGSAVLVLADEYPAKTVAVPSEFYAQIAARNLHLYIEFPSSVPGVTFGQPRQTTWERFVIRNPGLGPLLPQGKILMAHQCAFLPANAEYSLIVAARVAGYDHAVFGIPTSAQPILFLLDGGQVVVATTKLSSFQTARFAPTAEWEALWKYVLHNLSGADVSSFHWTPRVRAMYGPDERLPRAHEKIAFKNAVKWCYDSHLLISQQRLPSLQNCWKAAAEWTQGGEENYPVGDGRFGILEGYSSGIRPDGTQQQRTPVRSDCQSETAMVLAMDWRLNHSKGSRDTAKNLLDFIYFNSDICRGKRDDPKNPNFGLIAWGSALPAWQVANYGDDNARVMLSTMLTAACLKTGRWDEPLLRALAANLRTTGKLGFRGDRIDVPDLDQRGWKFYHEASPVNYSPHFESYLWACYLWAYAHTGETEYLGRAKTAIRMTMAAFPKQWRWNDNIERARMLLCLAWLVRVENTAEHRQWLRQVADDLISIQDKCGALQEHFRGTGGGYQIPNSNDAYGTSESPLIQENGDPVSDQLYVTGFALLGLHEAAAVVNDESIKTAENKLAEYACRIQNKSETLPWLAGTWFRAFDFKRWEAWASSGDAGWGAWSEEAGWGQAWTAAALALRQAHTTLWDITAKAQIASKISTVRLTMSQNDGAPWR